MDDPRQYTGMNDPMGQLRTGALAGGCGAPREEREIFSAMRDMEAEIAELEKGVMTLFDRISPILAPEVKTPPGMTCISEKKAVCINSSVGKRILEATRKINLLRETIESTYSRSEL